MSGSRESASARTPEPEALRSSTVARRIATKSPFSPPQHIHPRSAIRHLGENDMVAIISRSRATVLSR